MYQRCFSKQPKLVKAACRHILEELKCVAEKKKYATTVQSRNYSSESPDRFNFITDVLKPHAENKPDHIALWLYDGENSRKSTYKGMLEKSQKFANSLSKLGSPKCAQVILPKILPWWTVNLAGSFTGMIISPGTPMLSASEVAFRLEKSRADAIVCSVELKEKYKDVTKNIPVRIVADVSEEAEEKHTKDGWYSFHQMLREGYHLDDVSCREDGDAIAQLFFTSGTTGKPKMVPHTQAGYGLGHTLSCRYCMNLAEDEVFWNLSDLGWAKAAYSNLYVPLISGCTAFIHQMPRFDARETLKTLSDMPVTAVCFPPTAYRALIQEDLTKYDFKNLRKAFSAGEPLNPEVIDAWSNHTGVKIQEFYGQTETTVVATTPQGYPTKTGSFGKTVPGVNAVIVDEDLNELGPNIPGHLAISLKNGWPVGLCKEYYDNPSQTKKSFVGDLYLTGDKVYKDEEDYLFFVGRHDDIILSAGYRIGPFEVESALLEHPSVLESGVVSSPDEKRGSVVKAFIVLQEEYKKKMQTPEDEQTLAEDIRSKMKQIISPYKCPKKIEFVDQLPKTVSGKIRRVELRNKEHNKSDLQ